MKVIDIYNKIANGEKVPVFTIADDRYKYFMIGDYLYQQKYDYEPQVVEWQMYSEWLNEDIKVIEEDEFEDIEEINKSLFWNNDYELSEKNYQENGKRVVQHIQDNINAINQLIKNQKKIINEIKNKD